MTLFRADDLKCIRGSEFLSLSSVVMLLMNVLHLWHCDQVSVGPVDTVVTRQYWHRRWMEPDPITDHSLCNLCVTASQSQGQTKIFCVNAYFSQSHLIRFWSEWENYYCVWRDVCLLWWHCNHTTAHWQWTGAWETSAAHLVSMVAWCSHYIAFTLNTRSCTLYWLLYIRVDLIQCVHLWKWIWKLNK